MQITGLRKFFAGIRHVVPAYTAPFEVMPERLTAKRRAKDKNDRTKKALNREEIRRLLAWLRSEGPAKHYACILFLLTSGLRASEMLSLRWSDLDLSEGTWSATFTGKGGRRTDQELYSPAVEAARAYFQTSFHRDPLPDDFLFWTEADGDNARTLSYHTLWHWVSQVGAKARELGLIREPGVHPPSVQAQLHNAALPGRHEPGRRSCSNPWAWTSKTRSSGFKALACSIR